MLLIIICMFTGIVLGAVFRKRVRFPMRHVISSLVWVLLFMLGVSIGDNEALLGSLSRIGTQALVIGVCATLGSVIAAWLLWLFIKRRVS